MTRIAWGTPGERFFETGIDRGVLYIDNFDGVPWNGITSVSEAPTGGEARPYYLDGYQYLNISAAEEFEATINAFSSPREFDICDGTLSISNGLYATQQPRKSFHLSYRTMVGNDTEGAEHGYKIHLVYNALAAPSSRDNTSIGDSAAPIGFSWAITTLPPAITGIKPTAHMVIDSRMTPPELLAEIEDILYGSNSNSSHMPDVEELMSIFNTPVTP